MLSARFAVLRGVGKGNGLPRLPFVPPVRHAVPARQLSAVPARKLRATPKPAPRGRRTPWSGSRSTRPHGKAHLGGNNISRLVPPPRLPLPSLPPPATTEQVRKQAGLFAERALPWDSLYRRLVKVAYKDKSFLAETTAQLLARLLAELNPTIPHERHLESEDKWARRLKLLALNGISHEDLATWLWILTADGTDSMVKRFVSSGCHKPSFLLRMVLDVNQQYNRAEMLSLMISYVRDTFVGPPRGMEQRKPLLEHGVDTTAPPAFRLVLRRLVHHCLRLSSADLVPLAHLVAAYIEAIPLTPPTAKKRSGYGERCRTFNWALELFSRYASVAPIKSARHNWQAQKVLLVLSAGLKPHLIVNRNGYRSLRIVLLALKKNQAERLTAERGAKTWPPYRQAWDGTDERRNPEDDMSRSVKAGQLMVEAGYPPTHYDEMLTILGGSGRGRSPTIRMRAQMPVPSHRKKDVNTHVVWATLVQATRNEREAWMAFQSPPVPGLTPDQNVYAEMFDKLFAREVTNSPPVLPGDTPSVFPLHNGNLSPFEITRLTPPSPDELYHQMRQDGIQPTGQCLAVLLRNTTNFDTGLGYFNDSPYNRCLPSLLTPLFVTEDVENIKNMPNKVLNAWIKFLCNTHTRPRKSREPRISPGIEQAIKIVRLVQLADSTISPHLAGSLNYKTPWYSILRALATTKLIYSPHNSRHNTYLTVSTFLCCFSHVVNLTDLDVELFESLCLMVGKARRLPASHEAPLSWSALRMIRKSQKRLLKTGREFFGPAGLQDADETADARPQEPEVRRLEQQVDAQTVFLYMQALALCDEADEMVRLMEWILNAWEDKSLLDDAKASWELGFHYVIKTFAYFCTMAHQLVEHEVTRRLRDRLQELRDEKFCTWYWPSPSDADWEESHQHLATLRWWRMEQGSPRPRGG
ncbi:hypothetical protein B0T19DRAFT_435717 [Cercophora scortea]|uniref:Uncharacterized protein n=1 Tax=Cercophora scortea TaxID=314031 RepID=A0AAE0I3D3_9PEZI|nr:hypothetical protein B0T19DRAFT_435717 [Cercophora scortea]